MEKKKIGLIVNPVAGMGGSVGLKGTDGKEIYLKALELGAQPVTPGKAHEVLEHIKDLEAIDWLVGPGKMGENSLAEMGYAHTVIGEIGEETSGEDTRRIAKQMVAQGAELIVFVGGDGSARDMFDAVGTDTAVVAVPAGVKIFSAAFAISTRGAAQMIDAFVAGVSLTEEEVLDIDEEAYQNNRLDSRLYGYLMVPDVRAFLQPGKIASTSPSSDESKLEIAAFIVEDVEPQTLYILGPGSTVNAVADEMGVQKTLLGVDAVYEGVLVGQDLNEKGISALLDQYEKRKLVITPLGGNGFIFGRGSKMFTPQVIRRVGKENVIIVGDRDKVQYLDCLRVDSGDFELDDSLSGYLKVWVGYREAILKKVKC